MFITNLSSRYIWIITRHYRPVKRKTQKISIEIILTTQYNRYIIVILGRQVGSYDDFYQRTLRSARADRHGGASDGGIYPLEGDRRAAGYLGKISGEHRKNAGQGTGAGGTAGQGRRLPPAQGPRAVQDRRHSPSDGGVACPGGVPGEQRGAL